MPNGLHSLIPINWLEIKVEGEALGMIQWDGSYLGSTLYLRSDLATVAQ